MKKQLLSAAVIAFTACASVSASHQHLPDADQAGAPAPATQPQSPAAGTDAKPFARALAHAISLIDAKQFDAAREELNALMKTYPDEPSILFLFANTSMQLGHRAEGEAYFERYHALALRRKEYKPGDMLLVLARLCRERDDIAASRKWLDQVDPNDQKTYFAAQIQRSMLLAKEKNVTGALALVDSLEPRTPDDLLQVILSKADYLRQLGRLEEAYEVLAAGTPRVAPEAELLNLYASVANETGRFDVAESAAQLAIARAPGEYTAYNNLASWYVERNVKPAYALQLASKALEIKPDSPYAMDTVGYAQYRLGNLEAAETQLRRAYAQLQHPEIALHLVEVLLQKGERDEARQLMREASAKLDSPPSEPLRKKIEGLQLRL
ncbi:tetratricopeptide repeat protein [Herbaspirillum sp. SJZ107]|uniref:tetratricopeptide repeat protein n=1 Tax=Herbaspirillum sp. SJZ107 TaxID=2572881 RepID=UPI00114D8A41|nr:tetratricopeptide repeat protein [Herbaspirillum sp. SJZ107]TQK07647.1 Flp pilus assembly protein TadD [Herbaspirillum sp. SJZ107]